MVMGKKSKVTLYMDKKVVEKAKNIGLNLSKVCENALIRAIEALEQSYQPKEPKIIPVSNKDNQ